MTFQVAVRRVITTESATKKPKSTAIKAMEVSLAEQIRQAVEDIGGVAIVTLNGIHIAETIPLSSTKSVVCIDAYITEVKAHTCPLHQVCEMATGVKNSVVQNVDTIEEGASLTGMKINL